MQSAKPTKRVYLPKPKSYVCLTLEELAHTIIALEYVEDVKYSDAPEVITPLIAKLGFNLANAFLNQ
jgi:hypothetical protein